MIASFSGGLSSAYMTLLLKERTDELKVVFFNTGLEHEKTLEFVDRCDRHFGLNVTWLESVTHLNERASSTHKIVDFKTAHRGTKLFENMVEKYGLMGPGFLHCTRELKLNPFKSWKKEFAPNDNTAIGIRSDEMDRVDPEYKKKGLSYPLISLGITKRDVNDFWEKMPFTLEIPNYLGNCVGCWKKSDRKLIAVAKEMPQAIMDLKRLEEIDPTRKMFRNYRTTQDILKESNEPDLFSFSDSVEYAGCKESCEVF